MAENVRAFQLTNLRLGIIDSQGRLMVKEGNLRAGWIQIAEQVTSFQLSNYRLLVGNTDGSFSFQSGNIYQPLEALDWEGRMAFLNDEVPARVP